MSIQDSNQGQSLYAARIPIFPRRVKGTFRTLKWWIMGVTLAIYYLTPWIRWDRGPAMPDQAVLVDLANRRFFFFWIEIWPQQFIYVAGLLIMAGLGLFLFTSALGRVWCGYTCPQTVWTDLFITVERWIEGDRNARVRLHQQKWDARKARLRATKWLVWLLIAVATGGAWVFYFADAPTLLGQIFTGDAPFVAYASIGVLTATTFVFGGFMREQVCIYMCPWPRIQAAMMDDKTITVGYRHWRGEPRGKHRKKNADAGLGDCIDCNACVAVCPMGIDIRDGQQLACITCALCIDACDDVMDKVGKPRGLIDYVTLQDEAIETQGAQPIPLIKRILRPRTILYFVMWAGIGMAIVVSLFMRDSIDLNVARDRNPTYVVLSNGTIRNGYTIKVANQNQEPHTFRLSFRSDLPLEADIQGLDWLEFEVEADKLRTMRLFLTTLPFARPTERAEVEIWIEDQQTRERAAVDSFFLAPKVEDWGP
ncbi:cytochrome c oxidase accessory protein CcoG [Albimonas sp. CAU 1670]|uniref:cytochrome c oxidase accessory protein CcoG n=1 Tax=Albimonas sp. CAU 1670 TaxID=3032599 RepID=UPI0023DAE354|nr:cytochrome c oxidase accessory protein CcoG [Albimonas sp. CAU 1670]MDF2231367.1 cytochrome c oxidase accessory protein CcoG [Albimonas sp. CAU 1670]